MRFACDLHTFCIHLACDDEDEKIEEEKMIDMLHIQDPLDVTFFDFEILHIQHPLNVAFFLLQFVSTSSSHAR